MRRATTAIFVLFAIAVYAGCATLFTGSHDDVRFESEPEGARVVIDGVDQGRTPTTVSVKRSGFGDREVVMEIDGYEERRFTLEKQFNWASMLNLTTGILGWGIDIATGAIIKYNPQSYTMKLESEDRPANRGEQGNEQEAAGQERGEELPTPAFSEDTNEEDPSEIEEPRDERRSSEESPSDAERPGDGGEDISWVQSTLNELGYDCGITDGVMGPNTRSCIRAFQQENGLQATGAVNEETYEWMLEESPAYDLQAESQKEEESRAQSELERRAEEEPESQFQSQPESQPQPRSESQEEPEEPEEEPEDQENSAVQEVPAEMQVQSNTTGLMVRGYVSGNGLSYEDGSDSGRGLGAKLGYGFTPMATVYLSLNNAGMDGGQYTLAYFDLGVQINFRAEREALVPYVDVALSGIGLESGSSSNEGSGVTAGGGLKYFVSPVLALDGVLLLNYSRIEEEGFTGARLNLGVSWFPFR